MDEKQIELWEEKAKSGLIRGDTILSNALNKFRLDLYSVVENEEIPDGFKHLSAIGITTSTNYMDRGKLVINETKLKEAIEKNPDAVYSLFAATGSNEAQQGIAQRLVDSITKAMDQINERAGKSYWAEQQYSIGKNLLDINRRIESFEKRLLEIENRYWRQFTAMEKAVQRANQQSMLFMQQFGGTY